MRAGVFLGSFYGAKLPRITNTGSPVSEKDSSRKLADQARSPTPRYRIGMRVYGSRFPRGTLLGSSLNRAAWQSGLAA